MAGHFEREEVRAVWLADDGVFPNNSKLPMLIYPGAFSPFGEGSDPASEIEGRFDGNGWPSAWRNGVYPYQHYHATAHEVLGISRGSARVQFGGPKGEIVPVTAGDVVLLPAGTAHRRIEASADFEVVGAYPPDQGADMCYGEAGERPEVDALIKAVPRPERDPVLGMRGGVVEYWEGC